MILNIWANRTTCARFFALKLRLWTLEERRNRADLIEVFKMAHGYSAILLTDMFQIDTTGRGKILV